MVFRVLVVGAIFLLADMAYSSKLDLQVMRGRRLLNKTEVDSGLYDPRPKLSRMMEDGFLFKEYSSKKVLEVLKHLGDPDTPNDVLLDPKLKELIHQKKGCETWRLLRTYDEWYAQMDPEHRMKKTSIFKDKVLDYLMEEFSRDVKRKSESKTLKVSFSNSIKFDTNITEAPDNQVAVSNEDGFSTQMALSFIKEIQKNKIKTASVMGSTGMTRYKDNASTISTRNSYYLGLGAMYHGKVKGMSLEPSYNFRSNTNKTRGFYRYAFASHTFGLGVKLKPMMKLFAYSDIFMNIIKVESGITDYRTDENAKDNNSFAANYILLNIKKYKEFKGTGVLFIRLSDQEADDLNQTYSMGIMNLSHKFEFKKYSLKPALGLQQRWQDKYTGLKRNDTKYSFEQSIEVPYKKLKVAFSYKYEKQISTLSNFKFDNNRFVFSIKL